MILDLRNNAGGPLDSALHAARLFLPAESPIVSLQYANAEHLTRFDVDARGKFPATIAVVLLVNYGTAGEAEVCAAARRDNDRASLVGSRTFGNGRIISQIPLHNGYGLLLPTACYIPPAGKSFYPDGLVPEIIVNVPQSAERALAAKGFGNFDWQGRAIGGVEADPPLARAFELLKKAIRE